MIYQSAFQLQLFDSMTHPIIIGISGASGAIYGVRLLEALKALKVETHLVITTAGQMTLAHETDYTLSQVQALASQHYKLADVGAAIASGSFKTDGMIIAPCSMRTLGELASGVTTTLLTRAADVTLKERRRLVLLPRESPLTLVHLRNMATLTEMGGILAPPVPAFYAKPKSLEEMIGYTVSRVLDLFNLPVPQLTRWKGLKDEI